MEIRLSKFTLPLMAALALGSACREATTYGTTPTAGSTAGASAGSTAGASAGTGGATAAPTSAAATLTGFMGGTVTGTATFTKGATAGDVTVTVALASCVANKAYPVHIHAGTSCADAMAQGDHWGPQRGEGIPDVTCAMTTGTSMHTRTATPANTAWTIGGDAATNVIGHAFVVHAPDMPTMPARIACGVITAK